MTVPSSRILVLHGAGPRPNAPFVLYWMIAARRAADSFALDRALEWSAELGLPLVVVEPLGLDDAYASLRLHRFALDGMLDNAAAFEAARIAYHPFVEREPGQSVQLFAALAARAAVVITDDHPGARHPTVDRTRDVRLEAVDSNGLLPMRAADREHVRAVDFRRHVQRTIREHPGLAPRSRPRAVVPSQVGLIPSPIARAYPLPRVQDLQRPEFLASLPIDRAVEPVEDTPGGGRAAMRRLHAFVTERLHRYGTRGDALQPMTSALSPYLRFGHVSVHAIFRSVCRQEGWSEDRIGSRARGQKWGFWGLSAPAEAFIDELVTWRELCLHTALVRPGYDRYASLPDWARKTLDAHRDDARPWLYDAGTLARAETHDPIWNAAQRELSRTGKIHGYLRMLWGKKILEWSASPEEALDVMLQLNDRHALDGRDPNSVGGVFWCLGRYDRPWGPERPIFGKVRTMTSEGARRKLRLGGYLARFGAAR